MWVSSSDMRASKLLQGVQCAPADFGMPRLLVMTEAAPGAFVEGRQQIESDVGRLIVTCVGAADVCAKRTEGCSPRERPRLLARCQRGGVHSGHQARRDRLYVSLDAGNLA